jgi:tight adherence protein B
VGESLRLVAEEMPDPLATEFGRVLEEQNLGRDTRECFQNLCRRNPSSFDLRIFVSSVLLQRDTGGNLVEILQGIAHTIRERFVFQGKVGALTSEARFTAYILGGLPFAIGSLIFVFSPDYIKTLFGDPLGHVLVGLGAFWFLLGVFIMREVAKVEI